MLLTKNYVMDYKSYYWRAPRGSGKSVFLKLVGKELQSRGCEVYYFQSATNLEDYPLHYFKQFAEKAAGRTVALLIDEVQNNPRSRHWPDLLKENPDNLLVVGVGIPAIPSVSALFSTAFPSSDSGVFPIFLNEQDLPEINSYFKKEFPLIAENHIQSVCHELLNYTGGQIYPFVQFALHMFDKNEVSIFDAPSLFMSSQEFQTSTPYLEVKSRCFVFEPDLLSAAVRVLCGNPHSGDTMYLGKNSLYNSVTQSFVSPLARSALLQGIKYDKNEGLILDDSQETPYAEQIISAGLRDMKEEDFLDAKEVAVEDAISFRWCVNVTKTLGVWYAPQARMLGGAPMKSGAKPRIDFIFNGKLNLGIEVALNQNHKGLEEHLLRYNDKYLRLKDRGFVFHIDTKSRNFSPILASDKVYTFLMAQNALYRGSVAKPIKSGVSRYLQTPPLRTFSTLALRRLRG